MNSFRIFCVHYGAAQSEMNEKTLYIKRKYDIIIIFDKLNLLNKPIVAFDATVPEQNSGKLRAAKRYKAF